MFIFVPTAIKEIQEIILNLKNSAAGYDNIKLSLVKVVLPLKHMFLLFGEET